MNSSPPTASWRQVVHGALLVGGTSIGAGMLALPVLTGKAGFLPSLVLYFCCWLFMASTGLLFLELSYWLGGRANILSMAEHIFGRWGRGMTWLLYLFLFYCLMVAYFVGWGEMLADLVSTTLSPWVGSFILLVLFFPLILGATSWAMHVNLWLIAGLVLSYVSFIFLGFDQVEWQLLHRAEWSHAFTALPIAFVSFAYQGIVPSLVSNMPHNRTGARWAILIGSFIPLVVYAIWQGLILGIVPLEGDHGLRAALEAGDTAIHPLKFYCRNEGIYGWGIAFAAFAIATSFLGVSLGLRDFLTDGLQIEPTFWGKCLVALLVFFPPLAIALSHPHAFLIALDYAGGFGCALLLGLLPIAMVWRGRYHLHLPLQPEIPGGKKTLFILTLFVTVELIGECRQLLMRLVS